MEAFRRVSSAAAPLFRPNVDTDAIIPSREMKQVSKTGLSEGLFANWRYLDVATRQEDPNFVLNMPPYRNTAILIGGANFGCGSSREHAVWALREYGVRCIIAPSFGAIFQSNCVRNGILPLVLGEDQVQALAAEAAAQPGATVTVDLETQTVSTAAGGRIAFQIPPGDREMLLEGLDPIGITLKRQAEIAAFEARYRTDAPWRRIDLSGVDAHKIQGAPSP